MLKWMVEQRIKFQQLEKSIFQMSIWRFSFSSNFKAPLQILKCQLFFVSFWYSLWALSHHPWLPPIPNLSALKAVKLVGATNLRFFSASILAWNCKPATWKARLHLGRGGPPSKKMPDSQETIWNIEYRGYAKRYSIFWESFFLIWRFPFIPSNGCTLSKLLKDINSFCTASSTLSTEAVHTWHESNVCLLWRYALGSIMTTSEGWD